jgi:hypothetical protein
MAESEEATAARSVTIAMVRDHAWDYFALHAEQRLRMFHFFILLQIGLISAMLFSARTGAGNLTLGSIVGLLMALLSFVFWKLDQRTKGMIKVSETALRLFENRVTQILDDPELAGALPFINDPQLQERVGRSAVGLLSYSKCFGIVFLTFAILGALMFCVLLAAST